ncbi:ATP-binding protein [Sphingosinicella sp. LHD-64]|uniref:sensor histidine kinase n=1 Tax=Sphingosinicella sp. LHD-64 TaxID=3072139 RepID=UPI00280EC82F|nr:ATP-binding protein [Sphingosinicella sp. LHD-64]MDQ8755341.1 ATP-binding protein [Sphingosinicella sp. LHD-64]
MDGERDPGPVGADIAADLERYALLAREQAVTIAHYKKMYDRSSALARIGVWECDLATEALIWTDGVYDLFELPRGSAIPRAKIVEMYEETSRAEMERARAEAIRDGTGFALDILIRTARGTMRWLRLTADIEQDAQGRSVRIFGTKQDITQERAGQEQLRALQAELIHLSRRSAMSAMATTLAHELNQPLTAIGNYVAGTRRALADPVRNGALLERGLDAIEKCAFGAGDIIRSLRKMTSENLSGRRQVNPNALIQEAAALAMVGADNRVRLHYDLVEGLAIEADPVQIQQVFVNLVRNAIEAMEGCERRDIVITTEAADDEVHIRVDDTGHGIAPDLLATIFNPFVSSKPGGMGVGLSVSRTIIEAHGGRMTAANRARGGGASFALVLPRTGDADEESQPAPSA